MESQGCIGYTTSKFATKSTIHPSKRSRMHTEVTYGSCNTTDNPETSSNESTAENNDSSSSEYTPEDQTSKRKYHSVKSASDLVSKFTLSTRQASRVCQSLADGGVDLPTPSQTAIWRRVIENGKIKADKIKHLLQNEKKFCLRFDGKRIGKKEYEVICHTSPTRSVNLSAVCCDSGSSECIFTQIKKIIDEFDAWSSIQMIICDTTSVNTGRKNGIVIRLQKEFESKGFQKPQYIGCQNHVLDLILRHLLDFNFPTASKKTEINNSFVDDVLNDYEKLQNEYIANGSAEVAESDGKNLTWRDDYKFLFELCQAFKYFKTSRLFPKIKWRKLPSLHNARWNSRATFALLAFFLIPSHRENLEKVCNFISNEWAEAWFSNQHYKKSIYQDLFRGITELSCPKALKCFQTHWVDIPSAVEVARSNVVAERGIKIMEEIQSITNISVQNF